VQQTLRRRRSCDRFCWPRTQACGGRSDPTMSCVAKDKIAATLPQSGAGTDSSASLHPCADAMPHSCQLKPLSGCSTRSTRSPTRHRPGPSRRPSPEWWFAAILRRVSATSTCCSGAYCRTGPRNQLRRGVLSMRERRLLLLPACSVAPSRPDAASCQPIRSISGRLWEAASSPMQLPGRIGSPWPLREFRWPDGTITRSYTIITTDANRDVVDLHDRMPVIVEPVNWPAWLGEVEADDPVMLLHPSPDGTLRTWPVDRRVGSPRNNDAELTKPITCTEH
jgi:hypothetical protein